MLILEKKKLVPVLMIPFILLLACAIWAYLLGLHYGEKNSAELVLFLGFLAVALQLFLSVYIIRHSRQKQKDFLMLMKTIQLSGMLSKERAERLGLIGLELQAALSHAHEIAIKKSAKITSLHELVTVLVNMFDQPLLVINLMGEIEELSQKAQKEFNCKKGDMITHIIPEVDIKEIVKEASANLSAVEQEDKVVFLPVFSIGGITYFIVDMSRQGIVGKMMSNVKKFIYDEPPFKQKKPFFFF